MENLFLDTNYTTFEQMLLKVTFFLLISGLLLYFIYFVLCKVLFKKSKQRKEINMRLIFLWSLFTYFIIFNVYLFILIYWNGIDSFNWTLLEIYLGIFAQLTIYFCFIAFFFIKRNALNKMINQKSIN